MKFEKNTFTEIFVADADVVVDAVVVVVDGPTVGRQMLMQGILNEEEGYLQLTSFP
jgi:hypothetical protein